MAADKALIAGAAKVAGAQAKVDTRNIRCVYGFR